VSDPPLERVEELFHRAVELNPEQRAAYLMVECGGDFKLKAAVEALLKHDQPAKDATDFLESPIQRAASGSKAGTLRPGQANLLSRPGEHTPIIPGFEILEEKGRGGMGVVFKARQTGLNRLVALKMLLSIGPIRSEDLSRFQNEAASLAQLHHPNIVQIYEIGEHEGLPYFAMEYIEGPSLAKETGGTAQAPLAAVRIVEILARAMAAVHQRGIIHRDLKPANILLSDENRVRDENRAMNDASKSTTRLTQSSLITHYSSLIPKITDFGLAKQLEAPGAATLTGTVIGTPSYMPPEQARGDISGLGSWTDIYSLGAILYELLTGRPPIEGETPALTVMKILSDEPLPPSHWRSGLARDLDTICLKCLEKDPRRRYAGAAELAEDLRRYQAGEPISARPIRIWERIWRWCRRQPLAASALASTGALGLTLLTTVVLYNAQLRESLNREKRLAEERREQLVELHVSIAVREMDSGDSFAALLWFTEAMRLDEANENHRRQILEILEHVPWLMKVGLCEGEVLASRFTADDCWLAALLPDHSIRVWDVTASKYASPRLEHPAEVVLADFSPDGRYLATATVDGSIRLWRLENGQRILVSEESPSKSRSGEPSSGGIIRLLFAGGGRFLLAQSDDTTVRCWEITNDKALERPSSPGRSSSIIGPDGLFVYSLDSSGKQSLWNVGKDQTTTAQLDMEPGPLPSALSRDGSLVALLDKQHRLHIVETATGKVRGKPLAHARPVQAVVFTPNAENILTVDADHFARLRRFTKTGAENDPHLTVSCGSREEAHRFVRFGLNGIFLAVLGTDDRLRIWDVTTHRQATPPLQPRAGLRYEAFSADGKRLLLVGKDHTVRLWDLLPSASEIRAPGDHSIQPGMSRDFTLSHLTDLVQELTGIRLDEHEHPVPLNERELLAIWQHFQSFQSAGSGGQ
jgi:serine/threonine protein kinase